jgi:lysozyme
MVTWLIDISDYQESFEVRRAVAEGYSGVLMKATEGSTWRARTFDTFAEQTLSAGAVPGAYHYLRAGDGRLQCEVFFERIRDHGGPDGWMAACDNESDASWSTTQAFFQRWRELAGDHPLMVYSGNWWWSRRGWPGSSLTPFLWDSRYVDGAGYGSVLYGRVPDSWWSARYGGWGTATILQFSSSAWVAGREIDVNAFRGSVDELRALLTRGGPSGPGVVVPPYEGGSGTGGDWNLGMSFDEFKDGRVGASPPDWMGGPRDSMRMGDWYGAVPGKLSEIHATAAGAVSTASAAQAAASEAQAAASEARAAAVEALGLVRQVLDKVAALSVGGLDVQALAAALAPLLPAVPSVDEVADAVIDEAAARLVE